MTKDAYWFHHDANARRDMKIEAMVLRYGMAGYGMFWIVIEALREEENYQLAMRPYVWSALAARMLSTPEQAEEFVSSCIDEFELLTESDGFFSSESLVRRMERWEEAKSIRAAAASKAANARWSNNDSESMMPDACDTHADALQPHADALQPHADAMRDPCGSMRSDAKRGEEREEREERDKKVYAKNVTMTEDQYTKLCSQYGKSAVDRKIQDISDYQLSKHKRYKDYPATVRTWFRRDGVEPHIVNLKDRCPKCGGILVDGSCFDCRLMPEDISAARGT